MAIKTGVRKTTLISNGITMLKEYEFSHDLKKMTVIVATKGTIRINF